MISQLKKIILDEKLQNVPKKIIIQKELFLK